MIRLGVGLTAALAVLISRSALAATVTFTALPAGTILSNQLQPQGIVFSPYEGVQGVIGPSSSGNVATFNNAPGVELPPSGAQATFATPHSSVQVHVGDALGANPTVMTLMALDSGENIVATSAATVTPASGFSTQLSVTSPSQNIASFTVVATPDNNTSWVVISDISWDDNSGGPDFSLSSSAGVVLVAGQSVALPINIQRIGGSTGAINFSAAGLPAAVSATFNPNPADASPSLVLSAPSNASESSSIVTVTGTPTVPTAGPAPRSVPIYLDVVQPATVSGDALVDLSACNQGGPTGTVTVSFFVQRVAAVAGPLNVAVDGLPSSVQAQITPASLTFPNGAFEQSVTVVFTAVAGVAVGDTMASLHITGGGGIDQRFAFMIFGTCPRHQMDFVARGAWFCQDVGNHIFPLQHAVVEFFRYRSDWYDDKVGEVVTNDDGTYSIDLWAGRQGDYYSRIHLDDHLGAHLNGSWDLNFWSTDSEHLSNQKPLLDFGSLVISRAGGMETPKCSIWNGAHQAHEEYKRTVPPPNPQPVPDYSIIIWEGFRAPYSSLASTNWPDAYSPSITPGYTQFDDFRDFMVNFHEFGHTIRQSVDGDYTHFVNDASLYTYARFHGYCDLMGYVGNAGFAFNEGWAEYWSTQTNGCPYIDDPTNMNVEGDVAKDLGQLAQCNGVGRLGMMSVLIRAGNNKIHGDPEFRKYYQQYYPQCPFPLPLNSGGCTMASGDTTFGPARTVVMSTKEQLAKLQQMLADQSSATSRLQAQYATAEINAKSPGVCDTTCEGVARRLALPSALAGKIQLSRLLEGQLQAEIDAMKRGQRGVPIFDFKFDAARRQNALAFRQARRQLALDSLNKGAAAVRAREADYAKSDLPSYRRELERLISLLGTKSVEDDTLTSFIALRGANEIDSTQQLPPGFTPPRPHRHRWWWLFWIVVVVVVLLLAAARFRRRRP
jgi:hypothetical protein